MNIYRIRRTDKDRDGDWDTTQGLVVYAETVELALKVKESAYCDIWEPELSQGEVEVDLLAENVKPVSDDLVILEDFLRG